MVLKTRMAMDNLFSRCRIQKPDSYWGWVALFSSTLVMSTSFGFLYNFGLFYARFLTEYKDSKEKTAWVGSIPMAIMHLLAWLASWLISRYGLRNSTISAGVLLSGALFITSYAQNMNQIFLTFSIPFGLVGCVLLMSSFISVFTYFDKRLPLAMGILTGGAAAAQVGMTYIYLHFLNTYELKTTLKLVAGLSLFICFMASLTFLPTSYSNTPKTDQQEKGKRFQKYSAVLKNRKYLVFLISDIFDCFAYAAGVHQVQLGLEMGVPPSICNQFPVYTSISSAIGRVFCGVMLDYFVQNKLLYYQGSLLVVSIIAILGLGINKKDLLIAFVWIYGFFDGHLQASVPVTVRYLTGIDKVAEGFSILMTAVAIPIMLGPPVIGFIVDRTKSYSVYFYVIGLSHMLACGIAQIIRYIQVEDETDKDKDIKQRLNPDNEAGHEDLLYDKNMLRLETPV